MNFILTQLFGGVALILVVISYLLKSKVCFLGIQIIANIFYGLSFIFSNAIVAGINSFVSILRVLLLYYYARKNKNAPIEWIFILSSLYLLVGVIFFNSYYDIVVMITPILFTIAMWLKNMQFVRLMLLIPNVILAIYAILFRAYTTAVLNFIELITIIIALIKYSRQGKTKLGN